MANPENSRLLTASEAAPILAAAGITRDSDVGEGQDFTFGQITYWILQMGVTFPYPTSNSPDGKHLVYSPSQGELDQRTPPDPFDYIKQLLASISPLVWGVVLILILIVVIQFGSVIRHD